METKTYPEDFTAFMHTSKPYTALMTEKIVSMGANLITSIVNMEGIAADMDSEPRAKVDEHALGAMLTIIISEAAANALMQGKHFDPDVFGEYVKRVGRVLVPSIQETEAKYADKVSAL